MSACGDGEAVEGIVLYAEWSIKKKLIHTTGARSTLTHDIDPTYSASLRACGSWATPCRTMARAVAQSMTSSVLHQDTKLDLA